MMIYKLALEYNQLFILRKRGWEFLRVVGQITYSSLTRWVTPIWKRGRESFAGAGHPQLFGSGLSSFFFFFFLLNNQADIFSSWLWKKCRHLLAFGDETHARKPVVIVHRSWPSQSNKEPFVSGKLVNVQHKWHAILAVQWLNLVSATVWLRTESNCLESNNWHISLCFVYFAVFLDLQIMQISFHGASGYCGNLYRSTEQQLSASLNIFNIRIRYRTRGRLVSSATSVHRRMEIPIEREEERVLDEHESPNISWWMRSWQVSYTISW